MIITRSSGARHANMLRIMAGGDFRLILMTVMLATVKLAKRYKNKYMEVKLLCLKKNNSVDKGH
jgi:hypothetical protein